MARAGQDFGLSAVRLARAPHSDLDPLSAKDHIRVFHRGAQSRERVEHGAARIGIKPAEQNHDLRRLELAILAFDIALKRVPRQEKRSLGRLDSWRDQTRRPHLAERRGAPPCRGLHRHLPFPHQLRPRPETSRRPTSFVLARKREIRAKPAGKWRDRDETKHDRGEPRPSGQPGAQHRADRRDIRIVEGEQNAVGDRENRGRDYRFLVQVRPASSPRPDGASCRCRDKKRETTDAKDRVGSDVVVPVEAGLPHEIRRRRPNSERMHRPVRCNPPGRQKRPDKRTRPEYSRQNRNRGERKRQGRKLESMTSRSRPPGRHSRKDHRPVDVPHRGLAERRADRERKRPIDSSAKMLGEGVRQKRRFHRVCQVVIARHHQRHRERDERHRRPARRHRPDDPPDARRECELDRCDRDCVGQGMRARGTEDRPAREQREQAIAVAEIDLRSQPPADQMIHREDRTLVQRRVFIEQEVLVPPKSDQDRRFRRENKRKQAPAPRGFRFHRDRLLFSRKDSKWGPGLAAPVTRCA